MASVVRYMLVSGKACCIVKGCLVHHAEVKKPLTLLQARALARGLLRAVTPGGCMRTQSSVLIHDTLTDSGPRRAADDVFAVT